jgi:hypothetical protein
MLVAAGREAAVVSMRARTHWPAARCGTGSIPRSGSWPRAAASRHRRCIAVSETPATICFDVGEPLGRALLGAGAEQDRRDAQVQP